MAETLNIAGTEIAPGTRVTIDLPLPRLYTHTRMQMPVRVIRGRRPGPTLFVSAAVHGDEINGVEIIRRLLAMPLLRRIQGTLLAIPVVNVYGLVAHSRYLPDRRDLNRSFPGSDRGSLTARLANLFLEEIVSRASHGIDLHTGAIHRTNLPQIRTTLSTPETGDMARAFGAPVILNGTPVDGSLRMACVRQGIPFLVYEGGEALRFDELAIRAGVRGVVAVMRHLGMLPATRHSRPIVEPMIANASSWARAPQSGIMRSARPLGARVGAGAPLAFIGDPFGEQDSPVVSRHDGIVIGRTKLPLASEGDALFNVARFEKPGSVHQRVEAFHEELAEMDELAGQG